MKKIILLGLILPAAACALLGHSRAKTYTPEEIAAHSSGNDCWFSIRGRVYDVTKFIPHHPGGPAILEACGKDATVLFDTKPMGSGKPHSFLAKLRSRSFRIGGVFADKTSERS